MKPVITQNVCQFSGSLKHTHDTLAQETPIALIYNGISHVVMMATPQNIHELALGFSLSEGILQHTNQLYDSEIIETAQGIEVHLTIASERFIALKERRRSISGRTGCGLCGIDSLAAALPPIKAVSRSQKISVAHIQAALNRFHRHQPLREQTGSLHAAAWVEQGNIQTAFEDVGRHNALDKLLGHIAKQAITPQNGFILVSSRASYEMVSKTAALGIGALVAVSAATSLAVNMAAQANLTLIGFAKPHQFTIYSHESWVEVA